MMSYDKGKKVFFVVMAVLFFGALLAGVVMLLWNWLMPDIFGITTITFLQAIGILALSKLLFGGFMHNRGCKHCGDHRSKWKNISSMDKQSMKEKFMQKWAECHSKEDAKDESPGQEK